MGFTAKQERNGADVGDAGTAMPVPGPYPATAAPMDMAVSAADARMGETAGFMSSPAGAGAGGHEIGGGGDMFAWDAGLAINDVEGGGSG